MIEKIISRLIGEEGDKQFPYDDDTGKTLVKNTTVIGNITIGIGRNLSEKGLSFDERRYLCRNDVISTFNELSNALPYFSRLNEARQIVLVDLCFNMGLPRLLEFKKMLAAIEAQDFKTASVELMDSLWASQVKSRAQPLADILETGIYK